MLRRQVLPVLLAALLVSALGLTACGGDSDEDQINEIADRAILENDPSSCDEVVTDNFIEQVFAGNVDTCKTQAENEADDPDSIEVNKLEIDGDKATAEVKSIGGPNDGQVLPVAFVNEDGDWKFDSADAIAGALSPAVTSLLSAVEAQAKAAGLNDAGIKCSIAKLQSTLQPEDVSALVREGEPNMKAQKKIAAATRQCAQASP